MRISQTLFALLDSCLGADGGPAGFRAKIAVGVLDREGIAWWVTDFGDRITQTRPESIPDDCQTVVILGEREAMRLVDGKPIGRYPRTLQIFGDRRPLMRFLQRYVKRQSVFGLRVATIANPNEVTK